LSLSNDWNIFSAPELADEAEALLGALLSAAMAATGIVKAAATAAAIKRLICILPPFTWVKPIDSKATHLLHAKHVP
jgi:hypothetical protein